MSPSLNVRASVYFNDLYSFDPASAFWTAHAPAGTVPSARQSMGFARTPDDMMYLFGGYDGIGGWVWVLISEISLNFACEIRR